MAELLPTDSPPRPARPIPGRARAAAKLLRPHQWTKNLICFLPPFCAGLPRDGAWIVPSLLTFAAFCLGSSFVYILNDLHDIERDRAHPRKRHRPLPAGLLSRTEAIAIAAVTLGLCVACCLAVSPVVLRIIGAYTVLNYFYSTRLKHIAILDTMIISSGFLFRIGAGGEASGIAVSAWLILCAFFLSLFLAFSKRRAELNLPEAGQSRVVLGQYTVLMLDRFSNICATLAIATYALFTVIGRPDHALLLTCPPVVFGIFRYLLLIETKGAGETPEMVLLKDLPIGIAIAIWVATYVAVLNFGLRVSFL